MEYVWIGCSVFLIGCSVFCVYFNWMYCILIGSNLFGLDVVYFIWIECILNGWSVF